MIGHVARRGVAPARTRLVVAQRRTMFNDASPNPINELQRQMQKGSTPYLRGDVDPTYLRKSSDGPVTMVASGICALGWAMVGYYHYRMWNNYK